MLFQEAVKNVIADYAYHIEDIDYINLSSKYTISVNGFFELNGYPPGLEEAFRQVSWSKTWIVPEGFRIVMNDGSLFLYMMVQDDFYSRWIHVQYPRPSPTELNVLGGEVTIVNRRW